MSEFSAQGNAGIAFALVCVAGASSVIGASAVFFPCLANLTSKRLLAGGLGFSAGVLLYVGLGDLLGESFELFEESGETNRMANIYTSLSFFGGVFVLLVLDKAVHHFASHNHHEISHNNAEISQDALPNTATVVDDEEDDSVERTNESPEQERKRLHQAGIKTALAIGVHHIPEGLSTFVAATVDPAIGVLLAVAISLHNIPLGLSISLPMYHATGCRWKAFLWGIIPAFAQPFAALLGYLFLINYMTLTAYAVCYGATAGMMVIVSMKELLPLARKYDPTDFVVTISLFGAMFVVAISLVLLH